MNKTKQNLYRKERGLVITLAVCISFSVSANNFRDENGSAGAVLLLAQAESCVDNCEDEKKSCLEKYTRTNINGVKFVTPEGVKLCGLAYRDCKSACK
jgi:hypothetical protein